MSKHVAILPEEARLHLSGGAAQRTELRLPPVARNLPRVSDAVPNQVIRADDLARTMVDVAVPKTGEPGGLVLENRDIRAMVERLHPSSCNH
jgi:hypothetical protein